MKKIIILTFAVLFAATSYGQNLRSILSGYSSNSVVEQAIKGGVFFASHSYQLRDTVSNQKFGRYGEQEFGQVWSLAVKTKGGYIVPDSVISPWEKDSNYSRYKEQYKPVSYKMSYREVGDTVSTDIYSNKIFPEYESIGYSGMSFVKDSSTFAGAGFETDKLPGEKQGWCIWYKSKNVPERLDSLGEVSIIIIKQNITVSEDCTIQSVKAPDSAKDLIGGIYVSPTVDTIGKVSFKIVGFIQEYNGEGELFSPFVTSSTKDELSPVSK